MPSSNARRATGQIVQRGPDKWLVRVFIGLDPGTGKRKYYSETVTGKATLAKKKLTELQAKADAGTLVAPEKLTLGDYLDRWLKEGANNLARQTRESYSQLARLYIKPELGKVEIGKLRPLDVQAWVNRLTDRPTLSPRTVHMAFSVLRSAMSKAEKWRMIQLTPCKHIDLPRQERKTKEIVKPEEVRAFLAAAEANPYGGLITLQITTGARPGEAMGVLWSDLDLKAGTWSVQRNLVRYKSGGWALVQPKTAAGVRQVSLPPSLVAILRRHKAQQAAQRLAAGPVWEDHGLVFTTATGTPFCRANVAAWGLKRILKAAGLSDKLCLYSMRHSLATNMLSLGEHPRVLAEQLGHTDPGFTMRVYSHVTSRMLEKAASRIEDAFFGPAAGPEQVSGRTSQA